MMHLVHRILGLKSITSRLFFWVIFLVFLSSCFHLLSYIVIDKEKQITETQKGLEYALTNQRVILENWANERAKEIQYVADMPMSKNTQLEQMNETFREFLDHHKELESIVFLDEEGFVVIDSARKEGIIHSDVSLKDRDYFIAAQRGEDYIYDVVISKATSASVIIFSSPVFSPNNEFKGAIFGAVHLSKVDDLLSESIHGNSGEIILLNQDETILSQLTKQEEKNKLELGTTLDKRITENVLTEEMSFTSYEDYWGEEVFGSSVPLFDGRYFLIHEIDKKEILQDHHQMIVINLGITLAILVIGIVLTIPVSQQLLRPFVSLSEALKQIKAGDYHTQLDPKTFQSSPLELQQMMKIFNEMSTTIYENNRTLQKLSNTDGLTGIYNRRVFDDYLEREWLHARRVQKPLSIALIDIDFFKELNDTFGHQVGDECLRKVSQSIKNTLKRPRDTVARYGGEEFAIILPETNSEDAIRLAEQIRKEVETLSLPLSGENIQNHVTISIGVACFIPSGTAQKEILIELADQALYEAKSRGRNRVITSKNP